jgi:glutamine amidotransferase-like uncharacterized protein
MSLRLRVMASALLLMVAAQNAIAASSNSSPPPSNNLTRIAFYIGPGTTNDSAVIDNFFATLAIAAGSVFGDTGGFSITNVSVPQVQALRRDDYEIIVFPGGTGNGQAAAINETGMAAVRAFNSAGGGYIGTCGGAFLGLQHLLFYGNPPPPTQEPFDRGDGPVLVEFLAGGDAALGLNYTGNITIIYAQGPVVRTDAFPPSVQVFAMFRSEIHSRHTNETTGEMINTPAITALDAEGGAGRVVLNSPHPEIKRADGTNLPEIYAGELRWIRAKQLEQQP